MSDSKKNVATARYNWSFKPKSSFKPKLSFKPVSLSQRAIPIFSWPGITRGKTSDVYCNTGDTDCQLIYNLYRNINSNLEDQNKKLDAQFKKVSEVYSTDYQKSNYQNANVMYYKFWNNILFWVYYLLVLAIIVIAVKSDASLAIKTAIIGSFVVYPFLINNIQIILYGMLKYIYAIVTGTVYSPPEF